MFRALTIIAAIVALAVSAAPASAGFIMKDGNICDPIRHIGC